MKDLIEMNTNIYFYFASIFCFKVIGYTFTVYNISVYNVYKYCTWNYVLRFGYIAHGCTFLESVSLVIY